MLTSLLITMQTRSPFEIVHLALVVLAKKKFFLVSYMSEYVS